MGPYQPIWIVMSFPFHAARAGWQAGRWLAKQWKLRTRSPTFGSGRLATSRDLPAGEGYPIGRLGRRLVRTHHESCVLMFGARGAGKSLTMGATLQHADVNNLIVQDPPRQLWNRFREPLEAKGYRVVKIDLDDPASGLGYNPVAYLADSTPLSWDRDVRDIANLIVADIDTAGKSGSHFRDMGAVFIKGILGWLYQYDQSNATPYGVASLLLLKSDDQREQAFKSMLATGDDSLRLAVNAWRSVGTSEGGSFKSTLTNALDAWTWRAFRALTDRADVLKWEDELTGPSPCAIFLCGGVLGADTTKHLVRMFFGQAAGSLARLYGKAGPLPRRTQILIDEGSVVGRCTPLVQVVAELRKAGVTTFLCYQSPSQLMQFMGKADGATIFSNSDLVIAGGLKSPQDYDLIAKLAGQRTVNPMTKGRDVSWSEAARPVIGADELFRLGPDKVAAVLGTETAILDRAYRIKGGEVRY
ncbi:MAG: type IV secretory system conjugative DNA transfer family protein [Hyphomicrobium sp.]